MQARAYPDKVEDSVTPGNGVEYPTANSRSEAETGLSEAKAMTEGNGNEYPMSKVRIQAISTGLADGRVKRGQRSLLGHWI